MDKRRKDLVIVAGCGRLGAKIASMFSSRGKDVVMIDSNGDSFRKLSPDYSGFSIEADATDIDVLEKAGVAHAETVVAVTDDDDVNIMVSQIARAIFDVPMVVVRLYDTEKEPVNSGYGIRSIYPARLSLAAFQELVASEKE